MRPTGSRRIPRLILRPRHDAGQSLSLKDRSDPFYEPQIGRRATWRVSALAQIRNRSGHIGVVDELEPAFAAVPASLEMRTIGGIGDEVPSVLCGWKRDDGDERGVE